jgi:hypothetical protein
MSPNFILNIHFLAPIEMKCLLKTLNLRHRIDAKK